MRGLIVVGGGARDPPDLEELSSMHSVILLFFFITLGLELSDANVYEPSIRALLGTASQYCEAVQSVILDWLATRGQIVFFRCLDVHHTPPDSGARQYKSRT
jgi:hypothetical protein